MEITHTIVDGTIRYNSLSLTDVSSLFLSETKKGVKISSVIAITDAISLTDASIVDRSIFFGHIAEASRLGAELVRLDVILSIKDLADMKRLMPSLQYTHVCLPIWDYQRYKRTAIKHFKTSRGINTMHGRCIVDAYRSRREMFNYCRSMKKQNQRLRQKVKDLSESLRVFLHTQERLK